jgi:polysaccharide biosynthesis/export protein
LLTLGRADLNTKYWWFEATMKIFPWSAGVLTFAVAPMVLLTAGCSSLGLLGTSGPSTHAVVNSSRHSSNNAGASEISLIDVSDEVTRRLWESQKRRSFLEAFGPGRASAIRIEPGDQLNITIWEAPPAVLFASGPTSLSGSAAPLSATSAKSSEIGGLVVDADGHINVPFVGSLNVAGQTPSQIQETLRLRLQKIAHSPQVIVQLAEARTASVTVVGEVEKSLHFPLSPKGERVLDALAAAGGARQPVGKMTLQITRGAEVASLPLETVIRFPQQNIILQPGDVLTALYQPFSFTSLGATGRSAEVNFESSGITLAQALGRIGGLSDDRADPRGVFIFRFERPEDLPPAQNGQSYHIAANGRVPVIYRLNMKDPATFFLAQSFPISDKDMIFVSNAPLVDFQKFVNVIASTVIPLVAVSQL